MAGRSTTRCPWTARPPPLSSPSSQRNVRDAVRRDELVRRHHHKVQVPLLRRSASTSSSSRTATRRLAAELASGQSQRRSRVWQNRLPRLHAAAAHRLRRRDGGAAPAKSASATASRRRQLVLRRLVLRRLRQLLQPAAAAALRRRRRRDDHFLASADALRGIFSSSRTFSNPQSSDRKKLSLSSGPVGGLARRVVVADDPLHLPPPRR